MSKGTLLSRLGFGAGLLLAGAGLYHSWENTSLFDNFRTPTVEVARRTESRRQDFLNQIAKDLDLKYLDGVVYDYDGTKRV
ncbi:MAG TPA: hypothetical protein VHA12_04380, partial [Candidatus Nanoarchaeia archaeon]|nr:hypothetical protein [Candidatus Nanoarchaeia archaeon]